ncbi:MAG: ShlB/FhaC/HecB family hemolysin secretion/activation protein [Nitrospira sp.]|nr:MAG: ShlB/FhaC/HecB family hemolysin secretion/activation protein [Nitrospira sp.]
MEIQAFAQVAPPLPPIFDPTGKSAKPPAPLKEDLNAPPSEPPSSILPNVPLTLPDNRLGAFRVFVHDIHVTGSTVFSDAELAEVTAPYRNRDLTTEDLEKVRLALTLLYVNKGYLTSGAVIPDQDVTFGTIVIQIVEGTLARIDVEGNEWFRSSYLRDRVARGLSTPLSIHPLQERIQLLQQDPRIERVNAELKPGDIRGESVLNVRVKDANPFRAWLEFNNYQTPTVGAERGLATVAHQNVTGHGDQFMFTYGRSHGVNPIIDTSYSLPLNAYETTFTAYYRRNAFLVVENPFRALDLNVDSQVIGIALRQPVYRTVTDEFAVTLTGEHLYLKTTSAFDAPGLPSLFIPGSSTTGVATVSALRFSQEYTHRSPSLVFAALSRVSVGLDVLGATINSGPLPDGQFVSWLGQAQVVKRLDDWWGVQLLGRVAAQVASDRLFPLEQMPVGGRFSVRGYRENTLVRDDAVLASFESRFPLLRFPSGEDRVQFAPFVDFGHAWNAKGDTPDLRTLASVGAGLRWMILPQERARFEMYWGQQLNHVRGGEGNMQDHGIHLQLVVQVL